jgi:hypothetical protein
MLAMEPYETFAQEDREAPKLSDSSDQELWRVASAV